MDDQLTIRLPDALARELERRARAQGVKRAQVVREALVAFLGTSAPGGSARSVRERIAPYVGSLTLDHAAIERDELARRIRAHNWRK
jgi:metal-responsive CopG/Arc/MetJ family transcriptional regulator